MQWLFFLVGSAPPDLENGVCQLERGGRIVNTYPMAHVAFAVPSLSHSRRVESNGACDHCLCQTYILTF